MANNTTTNPKAMILHFSNMNRLEDNYVLETSPQSNNSILIMSCEYASLGKKPPWYGDEMSIQQWSMLKMPIGSRTDTDAILTRQDGYTYDFYYTTKKFICKNASSQVVYTKTNVQTIADMHISFDIIKSHQFRIIISEQDSLLKYIVNTKLKKKLYGESPVAGIKLLSAQSNHSSFKKLQESTSENPFIFRGARILQTRIKYDEHRIDTLYKTDIPTSITINDNNINLINSTNVYSNDYIKELHKIMLAIPESTKISDIPLYTHTKWKVVKLINNIKKYMLYFNLSVSMYPELQGMVRPQSSNNNRPVYEPWLIWGVFKFIWLHRIENDDDMEIDVFDLSPTYEN